jgi:hypothetical protein
MKGTDRQWKENFVFADALNACDLLRARGRTTEAKVWSDRIAKQSITEELLKELKSSACELRSCRRVPLKKFANSRCANCVFKTGFSEKRATTKSLSNTSREEVVQSLFPLTPARLLNHLLRHEPELLTSRLAGRWRVSDVFAQSPIMGGGKPNSR